MAKTITLSISKHNEKSLRQIKDLTSKSQLGITDLFFFCIKECISNGYVDELIKEYPQK